MKIENELTNLRETLNETTLKGKHFTEFHKKRIREEIQKPSKRPGNPKMLFPKVLTSLVCLIFVFTLGTLVKDHLEKSEPEAKLDEKISTSDAPTSLVPLTGSQQLKMDRLDENHQTSSFEFILPKWLPAGMEHASGLVTPENGKENSWNEKAESGALDRKQLTITENPGTDTNLESTGKQVSIGGVNGWLSQTKLESENPEYPFVIDVQFFHKNTTFNLKAYNIPEEDVLKIAESLIE
ncbi:DUF4367 domain-containing protein [Bacillus sp. FJAT-29814]|uniref:DUF4367 domain-containing protein n=1 Tax=Bacillus sp. FJAT-29814 TaxID=1729688 RepID=UPI0008335DA9|nr:DUF4367 domain-containing protein [Bacillus sp. FJAT-29814]